MKRIYFSFILFFYCHAGALCVKGASNCVKIITIRFSMVENLLSTRIHNSYKYMCNYFRTELFIGSQILPGFTKRKEKISNLDFSGLYPYIPYRLGIGKRPYSKKLASFWHLARQIGRVYEAVEVSKKTGRTEGQVK